MKPQQEGGDEAGVDLTAKLVADMDAIQEYSESEISKILETSRANSVDIILLCGPRIKNKDIVEKLKNQGFGVGAWGVALNLELAKQLIEFGLDRFTLDNPEQLA